MPLRKFVLLCMNFYLVKYVAHNYRVVGSIPTVETMLIMKTENLQ